MLDVKKTLAKLLRYTEKKDLLWSNSSSPFASQTVSLDLSKYDRVEVWFMSMIGTNDALFPNPLEIPIGERRETVVVHGLGAAGVNENIGMRGVSVSSTSVTFGTYNYKNRRSGGTLTTANQFAVPKKIYGIKVGGVVRRLLKALKSLALGRGWVFC